MKKGCQISRGPGCSKLSSAHQRPFLCLLIFFATAKVQTFDTIWYVCCESSWKFNNASSYRTYEHNENTCILCRARYHRERACCESFSWMGVGAQNVLRLQNPINFCFFGSMSIFGRVYVCWNTQPTIGGGRSKKVFSKYLRLNSKLEFMNNFPEGSWIIRFFELSSPFVARSDEKLGVGCITMHLHI